MTKHVAQPPPAVHMSSPEAEEAKPEAKPEVEDVEHAGGGEVKTTKPTARHTFGEHNHEEAHGLAGRILQRLGPKSYPFLFVIPIAFVAIFLAVIPLNDPNVGRIGHQATFLFVTNLAVMATISYVYGAVYFGFMDRPRPFRKALTVPIAVVIAEIVVMTPIFLTVGPFALVGLLALGVAMIGTYGTLVIIEGAAIDDVKQVLLRFQLPVFIFIGIVALYAVGYREATNGQQAIMVVVLAFVTFIVRRVSLSLYDPYPLEMAILVSGLWFQNLSDIFQTLAFPQVGNPSLFAAIWFANSFGNFAMLGFISDPWIFKIRPWLKSHVLAWFKCDFRPPPRPEFDYSYDFFDRGHGPNVGGYRRRQFRFFFWRLVSQGMAVLSYMAISPMLRFGLNKEYFTTSTFDTGEYRNSMIYSASYLAFLVVVYIIGYLGLKKKFPETFDDIQEINGHEILHHTFIGFVIAILVHNLFLAIAVVLAHYCVSTAFQGSMCLP